MIVHGELRAGVRKSTVRPRGQGAKVKILGQWWLSWRLEPLPHIIPLSLSNAWHWGVPGSRLSSVSGLSWPLWVGL